MAVRYHHVCVLAILRLILATVRTWMLASTSKNDIPRLDDPYRGAVFPLPTSVVLVVMKSSRSVKCLKLFITVVLAEG